MGIKLERWKVDEVLTFLGKKFLDKTIDHYRKDNAAHLFVIQEVIMGRRETLHQLLIMRRFLDNYPDPITLRDSLTGLDLVSELKQSGDKTVTLH